MDAAPRLPPRLPCCCSCSSFACEDMDPVARLPPPHPRCCSGSSLVRGDMDPAARLPAPPPHPRRSLIGGAVDHHSTAPSKKEVKTSMGGRAYYFRRCKNVPASNIECLPDEVLSEILVRLSADELYERARFVCRQWYYIIHSDAFINAQRPNSNWGLLLSTNHWHKEHLLFLGVREGRLEVSKLNPQSNFTVLASCNGLVLWRKFSKVYTVSIVNLLTKQEFSLPSSSDLLGQVCLRTFSIAYAAASMEYKVVRTYLFDGCFVHCHILTAGIDSNWRCVGLDNLSCGAKELLLRDPLITEGFMHWTWFQKGTHVLTLNVETEMFTESHVPLRHEDADGRILGNRFYYRSAGRRLTLLFACRDLMWQLWELEGESGEWRKLRNIDMEAQSRVEQELLYRYKGNLVPVGWVTYPVLLVFSCLGLGCTCIVYNLDTDEIDTFKLPQSYSHYEAVVHRKTLEWLSTEGLLVSYLLM